MNNTINEQRKENTYDLLTTSFNIGKLYTDGSQVDCSKRSMKCSNQRAPYTWTMMNSLNSRSRWNLPNQITEFSLFCIQLAFPQSASVVWNDNKMEY